MKHERLERRIAFEGRVFRVASDRVRVISKDGSRETRFDLVLHPGAVAVVPVHPDGSVTLVRQLRYAVGGRILEVPAGTREPEEPWETCAARELAEEAGLRAGRWTPLTTIYTTPGFCDEELRLYLAEELTPCEGALDEDEVLEVERMPLAAALAMIEAGGIRDAKTIVGLCLARDRLRTGGGGSA